jgi:predicted negative regulator of RcsB-dependent stress response
MKKNIAAALVISALAFSGGNVFAAADAQRSQHIAEALKHAQEALDHAKQGHNDVLIEHAKQARKHAKEIMGDDVGVEMQKALTSLRLAVEQAEKGDSPGAVKSLEEVIANLNDIKGQ